MQAAPTPTSVTVTYYATDQTCIQTETWQCSFAELIKVHHAQLLRLAVVSEAVAIQVDQKRMGSSEVTTQELYLTEWLNDACLILSIELRDHTVTTSESTFSCKECGLL